MGWIHVNVYASAWHTHLPGDKDRRKDPDVPATYRILRKLCWLAVVFLLSHLLEILDGRQRLALNSDLSGTWLLS